MPARALVVAQTEANRQTPSPTGPQPSVHPRPGWEHNQNARGIQYMFLIPNEGEGREVAPFIQVNRDTDYPKLMATRGRGCNIHTRALQAIPNPYPCPQFTQKEEFFFQDHELFTPLVDQAIHLENDPMLAVEVQQYQNARHKSQNLAMRLGALKDEFNDTHWTMHDSTNHLAAANAHNHLHPHTIVDLPTNGHLP